MTKFMFFVIILAAAGCKDDECASERATAREQLESRDPAVYQTVVEHPKCFSEEQHQVAAEVFIGKFASLFLEKLSDPEWVPGSIDLIMFKKFEGTVVNDPIFTERERAVVAGISVLLDERR
ncbi:hypothetical protein KJ758_00925 [Patescibacteria group bacterium]|nr:hypothetical protein [Patescibacteria group bacterium]